MLTSNDAAEDIQRETNVINSTTSDISSSPIAVRSFRKAEIHSDYQSVKDGQQPVSIMQQNKVSVCCHCSNHGSIHNSTVEA